MSKLLRSFGAKIKSSEDSLDINCSKIINKVADYDIVRKMRASILILGPLLALDLVRLKFLFLEVVLLEQDLLIYI